MSTQRSVHHVTRLVGALIALVALVAGLPALLVIIATRRFGHVSPLHGVKAPWHWSVDDLHSWATRLTAGLDSSAQLVDLFFHIALVIGWICAAILIYTVVDELSFQIRHGMPTAHHRSFIGIGRLGRHLATALVALLPLSANASAPALATSFSKPATSIVQQMLPERDDPVASVPIAPTSADAPEIAPVDQSTGWSLVEVQRGDSVWSIAERVADGRDVASVAQQIAAANLGTIMGDGHRFSTPALIEPGWVLNVPASGAARDAVPTVVTATSDDYIVQAGDSYWHIAESHLDQLATGGEIAAYTQQLMALNAAALGYSDARLIRPGDVVQLGLYVLPDVVVPAPTTVSTQVAPVPDGVVVPDAPPPSDAPLSVGPPPSTTASSVPTSLVPTASSPSESSPNTPDTAVDPRLSAIVDDWSDDGVSVASGLAAAVVLAGGAIAALGSRRRHQLRGAVVGARLVPPTEQAVETEMLLRSLSPGEQLARVDLALRCAAQQLVAQHARPLAVEIDDAGEIRLYTDRPATAVPVRWALDPESGAWRLPGDVPLADLAGDARRSNQPCPAIVHIGESAGGRLFVDLEAVGSLAIDAPPAVAASIVRCAAASLAVSPFAEASRIFTVGLEIESQLGSCNVEALDSLTQAIATLHTTVGSTAAATGDSVSTFALRALAGASEAWEPSLLLAVGQGDAADLAALISIAGRGGRGVGVMFDRQVGGAGAVLRADDIDFVLEPLGRRVTPVGLSVVDVAAVDELLRSAERPLEADVHSLEEPPTAPIEFAVRAHTFVVRVLGQVVVETADGVAVAFDRSKAQELVVWLSQHRTRPTRTSARTALWDLAVRDATFSNVVSDARRAMARVVPPPSGAEWVGRTMNEDLPLHEMVISDAELLADRVAAARHLDNASAIAVLHPGVASIQGMPFAGTSYLWPDAEGITSALVLLATTAAADLAAHYLSIGDVDGVFWATGQGLKVLAGHEELIALRMRAHADRGDLAGVRNEWESYERALTADTWSSAEPSPKLVRLRRELLAPLMAS